MKLTATGVLALGAIAALVLGGFALFANRRELAAAVNPASSENIAYRAAGGVVGQLTEGAETSVGGVAARLREWWSGDDAAIEAMKRGTPPVNSDGSIQSVDDYLRSNFIGA